MIDLRLHPRQGADPATNPLEREGLVRRTWPFVASYLLAYALVPIGARIHHPGFLIASFVLAVAVLGAVALVPWSRLPRPAALVPVLATVVIIALLRQALGGGGSGYSSLTILPVIWLALYGTRLELLVTIAAIAVMYAVPILVAGSPDYPPAEWRRGILATVLDAMVGLIAQTLVAETRHRYSDSRRDRARLQAVISSTDEGIITLDRHGRISSANPAACTLLRATQEELVGHPSHETLHHSRADGSPYPATECPMIEVLDRGVPCLVSDEVFWRSDGTSFPVEYRGAPIRGTGAAGAVMLFHDITERRRVDQMKDEFLSVVSHELRTPLTSIRGSLGLIAMGRFGKLDDQGARMLDIALTNTDRLARLINDILDVERIESGTAPMEPKRTTVEGLIEPALDAARGMADEAGVKLVHEGQDAIVRADPDRIVQALTNLLGNAVKFSPAGGTVTVRSAVEGDHISISVRDEGRGIPPEDLERIFERFEQVDASDAREKGGSGLGLSIARGIVRQHDGELRVESEVGRGSTFTILLPQPVAAPGELPRVLVVGEECFGDALSASFAGRYQVDICGDTASASRRLREFAPQAVVLQAGETVDGLEGVSELRRTAEAGGVPVVVLPADGVTDSRAAVDRALTSLAVRNVLVVEDDPDLADVLVADLQAHGIRARAAHSVRQAVQLARVLQPDAVVLDLVLPDGPGADVLDALEERALMPLVVYTAYDIDARARRRLGVGRGEVMSKRDAAPADVVDHVADLLARVLPSEPER